MKPLDSNDFRSFRLVLEPDDFAEGSDQPNAAPSDLIDKETWEGIVALPDDVSIRTSNEHGTALRRLWFYWDQWICLVGALQHADEPGLPGAIAHVACEATDEFQASIFCSMVGFYRAAFSSLRNILEHVTVGLHSELSGDFAFFEEWLRGQKQLSFGGAADLLPKYGRLARLESHWKGRVGDDLFGQAGLAKSGGFARRLFRELSKFVHGAPGFVDSDFRLSNGPIFVGAAFERWLAKFAQVYAVAILEAHLAKPEVRELAYGSDLTVQGLFNAVMEGIPAGSDGKVLLSSVPDELWS